MACLLCTVGSNFIGHTYVGVMPIVRRGLGFLFEEPADAVHLRHMAYEKFSTFFGMTNVLYDNDYLGHDYVGRNSLE